MLANPNFNWERLYQQLQNPIVDQFQYILVVAQEITAYVIYCVILYDMSLLGSACEICHASTILQGLYCYQPYGGRTGQVTNCIPHAYSFSLTIRAFILILHLA